MSNSPTRANARRWTTTRERIARELARIQVDAFPAVAPVEDLTGDERYTTRETMAWCRAKALVTGFDLDVAACEESHHADRWYSKADDGLTKPWRGRCWCNPPYSDVAPWVSKAWQSMAEGAEVVAMLIPATRTEQSWWSRWVEPYRDGRGAPLLTPPPPDQQELRDLLEANSTKNPSSYCWEWQRHRMECGYGRIRWRGRMSLAHRLSFSAWHHALPATVDVCHYCDNRSCINPEHLFIGSAAVNASDRDRKWRQARGGEANRGHLTEDDVADIRERRAAGESTIALAAEFRVHNSTIGRIARRERWSDRPPMQQGPLTTHFLPGRTAFARPGSGGVGQSGAPFGCVLLVFSKGRR